MDFQQVVAGDDELLSELLDRRAELATARQGGLETLGGAGGTEAISSGLDRMREGTYVPGDVTGAEAIILRFARPVFLIQDSVVTPPVDTAALFPGGESAVIMSHLSGARQQLGAVIPSVGRVNLSNHMMDWAGTGWMVASDLAVTNRHVAEKFAARDGDGFRFRAADQSGRLVKARVDWRAEHLRPHESVVRVEEVLWIEPDGGPDVAVLRVRTTDEDGAPTPAPVPLMAQAEVEATVGGWVAVIGYPARSPFNNLADQQRIFDGIYDVKRLAPGTVTGVSPNGELTHDATTLGGNSGSVILDLASGQAVGLHYGGFEGDRNMAVAAHVVADRVRAHT